MSASPLRVSAYAKAYPLADLRRWSGWSPRPTNWRSPRAFDSLEDADIVVVHDDFTVTLGIYPDEDILQEGSDAAWRLFCTEQLRFEVPPEFRYRLAPVEST
jgi:hypothetical protein